MSKEEREFYEKMIQTLKEIRQDISQLLKSR